MSKEIEPLTNPLVHYFVDEAGDDVLFNNKGKVLLGSEGCSRYFVVGLLQAADPAGLAQALDRLRASLLADPYFKGVPSMQPERQKTAFGFHAKDDLPEVRRAVFSVLLEHEFKFFAEVRDKQNVLAYVQERNIREPAYRYRPSELYDSTVARLFKNRLHTHDDYRVVFARRGTSDRTRAFSEALNLAKKRFEDTWQREVRSRVEVVAANPSQNVPLQAVDYMLWALQRHFERGESRFLEMMWSKVSLIHAVDETAHRPYGEYYTKKRPLFPAASE